MTEVYAHRLPISIIYVGVQQ